MIFHRRINHIWSVSLFSVGLLLKEVFHFCSKKMKRKQVPKIRKKTVKLEYLHETNFKGLRYGSPVFSVGFVQRYSRFFFRKTLVKVCP